MKYTYEELAGMIDHSLLHPTMTDQELEDGCDVAAKYGVASVCIKPYAVKEPPNCSAGPACGSARSSGSRTAVARPRRNATRPSSPAATGRSRSTW